MSVGLINYNRFHKCSGTVSILLEAVNPEHPFCSIVPGHKRKLFRSSDVQKVVT